MSLFVNSLVDLKTIELVIIIFGDRRGKEAEWRTIILEQAVRQKAKSLILQHSVILYGSGHLVDIEDDHDRGTLFKATSRSHST